MVWASSEAFVSKREFGGYQRSFHAGWEALPRLALLLRPQRPPFCTFHNLLCQCRFPKSLYSAGFSPSSFYSHVTWVFIGPTLLKVHSFKTPPKRFNTFAATSPRRPLHILSGSVLIARLVQSRLIPPTWKVCQAFALFFPLVMRVHEAPWPSPSEA